VTQTSALLNPDQQAALLESFHNIQRLPVEIRVQIRQVYAAGYSQQMRAMLYFCVASLISLALVIEWSPRRLQTSEDGEIVVHEAKRN
jgi:hypothetical protein